MPYGSLSGTTKNWTDKEVSDAKNAGIFLQPATPITPKSTSTATPTSTPISTSTSTSIPKATTTPIPKATTTTPITKTANTTNITGKPATTSNVATPTAASATTTPTSTTVSTPTSTTLPKASTTTPTTQNVKATNIIGTPATVTSTTGAATTPAGTTTPTVTPTGTTTPSISQESLYTLRDIATNAGLTVGNDGNIPTINGIKIDPEKAGLQLVNGRWQGTAAQVGAALGKPIELRGALANTNRNITWDPSTGKVSFNGIPIDTSNMINIGGRYYTTQDKIDYIVAATGGAYPVGQNVADGQQSQQGQIGQQGQEGQKSDNQFDASILSNYQDSLKRIGELENQINKMSEIKIPEIDYKPITEMLKELKNYKNAYDDQIKAILQETYKGFEYNPDDDPMLQKAIKYADRTMMEQMNSRGILNSSITEDNLRIIREDLLPQYQSLALERYNQELSRKFQQIGVLQSLSNTDYDRYKNFAMLSMQTVENISKNTVETIKANLTLMQNTLQNKITLAKDEAQLKANALTAAYYKLEQIGYVDNEIALLTGLPIGMPSKDARAETLRRSDEYTKMAVQYAQQKEIQETTLKNDIKKIDYMQSITNKEKKEEEDRKKQAAKAYASIGSMPADKALDEIGKNFGVLSEYLGSELWTLVDKLNATKIIQDKAAADKEQDTIKNSLTKRGLDIEVARMKQSQVQHDETIKLSRERFQEEKNQKQDNKTKESLVSAAYTNFIKSGKTFDEWLKEPVKAEGKPDSTIGEQIGSDVLNGVVDVMAKMGQFKTDKPLTQEQIYQDNLYKKMNETLKNGGE